MDTLIITAIAAFLAFVVGITVGLEQETPAAKIQAAQQRCAPNKGLRSISYTGSITCNNGAAFTLSRT